MITMIAAVGENNAIGANNKLLWSNKEELKHFKDYTRGKTIVMGRKTWESIPGSLPGRNVIVLSKTVKKIPGVSVLQSIDEVLFFIGADRDHKDSSKALHDSFRNDSTPYETIIAGGEEIYKEFMPISTNLLISYMHNVNVENADAFFPIINPQEWGKVSEKNCGREPDDFNIVMYERKTQ